MTQRRKLIQQLDTLVSQIVLKRDGRRCVLCGSTVVPECGHFHSRTHYATRWDLDNCHINCRNCNLRHEQDPWPYTNWMLKHYTKSELDDLYLRHRSVTHYKVKDLEAMKEELEHLLKIYEGKS